MESVPARGNLKELVTGVTSSCTAFSHHAYLSSMTLMGCSVSKFSRQGTHKMDEIGVEDDDATSMPIEDIIDLSNAAVMAQQNRSSSQNPSANTANHHFRQPTANSQKTDVINPENTDALPQQNKLVF